MNAAEMLLGKEALARHGDRAALICGEESLTFTELAARVAHAAGAFAALGVRPGERVLFLMRDTPDFAVAWLGAIRAGAVAVALNEKLSDAELEHAAADSTPRLAIVAGEFAHRLSTAVEQIPASTFTQQARRAGAGTAFEAAPESPAFMLYSSGTTGRPKGIVHAHRGFASLGLAYRCIGVGAGDRVFSTSKFFFAYGIEHGLLAALAHGATAVVYPGWPDADAVIELVARHRPAVLFSVPTVYRRLLAEPPERLAPFASVRRFVAAGERLSRQLVERWRQALGSELLNLYGMSETFCACMMTPPGTSDGMRTGVPLEGVQVELRDSSGHPPAAGEPGVLWIRHPAQATGYTNLPRDTEAQFRDGWFCSRDLFVRDAGGYYIHQGRSDELLKIAGQWVQPGELEAVAAQQAAVAEAVCVPVPDADGLERLALFVTASADPAAAQRAAQEACERLLPRHKRPKWVRAVDELPRTATGKVQRFKLREILTRELSAKD
ncbi:MAG TPA: AMP-binding protein [Burkholderiales bacterium]|jgi:benzoate-CoA ligase|nr:AMP-binding protein [Burkholderiales bacterium]